MSIVPLHKAPTKAQAQEIVRELARLGKVRWSKHARERMKERKVNDKQVLTCLEKGKVMDDPVLANKSGNEGGYDITVERLTAGEYLRVGACLRFDQSTKIITVIKLK